jgi:23S rRNA (adenine2503-C2)-methyltransferase
VIYSAEVARESVAGDGTRKLLLAFPDGETTETVWIPSGRRNTACLSTQVGCPVGCRFCASGLDGLRRNLTAGEIVEQALRIRLLIADQQREDESTDRLSNIVIMGMGEPLANYEQLVKALRIINAPWGLGIGARKITVSTIGLPKQIRRLAQEDLQLNLALSLHAPDDELRRELVPWAQAVPIAELIDACGDYFKATGREVTLEYVLLDDVNMRARHAEGLAKIAKRLRANVNLLRYNPVAGLPYRRPGSEATYEFQRRLRERGINAHVRSSRGRDVDAACGQLRRSTREA